MFKKRKGVSAREAGFTLIELVMVLVLLGILAAVAMPKYFDLEEEANKQAALAAVSEAQARVNAKFAAELMAGKSCNDAVLSVRNLAALSDTEAGSAQFGGFLITPSEISEAQETIVISAQRVGTDLVLQNIAQIAFPVCKDEMPTLSAKTINDKIALGLYLLPTFELLPQIASLEIDQQLTSLSSEGQEVTDLINRTNLDEPNFITSSWALTKRSDGSKELLVVDSHNPSYGLLTVYKPGRPMEQRTVKVSIEGEKFVY